MKAVELAHLCYLVDFIVIPGSNDQSLLSLEGLDQIRMRIKVDLEHADTGRCTDFGGRIVSSKNGDTECVGRDQALQKGAAEAAGLCGTKR